jgi:MFS family permease
MSDHQEPPGAAATPIRKVAGASLVGTTIEFYDFFIYGTAAALVFPKVFFPTVTPFIGTLLSFGSFGAGFIARPLGGIIFGHFGDRIGRKKMLIFSLLLMGLSTAAVGALPSYAAAGVLAPILLVTLRLLQGIALGGEWGGAVLLAVEHAPAHRRGFYGSWAQAGTSLGVVLSTGSFMLVSLLPADQFLTVGWRIPFLASVLMVAVGLFVRLRVTESPAFEVVRDRRTTARTPILEVLRRHPKQVLLVAGAFMSQSTVGYICIVYLVSYGTTTVGASRTAVLMIVMCTSVLGGMVNLACGALSDRFGRKRVYLTGVAIMGISIFPALALYSTGTIALMALGQVVVQGFGLCIASGATAAMFSEMFGTRLRYTGASLGYQLAGVFGAAASPAVAAALLESAGTVYAIAGYVAGIALVSFIAVTLIPESRGTDIVEAEPAPATVLAA